MPQSNLVGLFTLHVKTSQSNQCSSIKTEHAHSESNHLCAKLQAKAWQPLTGLPRQVRSYGFPEIVC